MTPTRASGSVSETVLSREWENAHVIPNEAMLPMECKHIRRWIKRRKASRNQNPPSPNVHHPDLQKAVVNGVVRSSPCKVHRVCLRSSIMGMQTELKVMCVFEEESVQWVESSEIILKCSIEIKIKTFTQ